MAIEKDLNVGANLYPTESGVAELGNSSKKWKIDGSQLTGTVTATTATTATKLGSSTVGGAAKPIYLNGGTATACSSTVGGAAKPVYMNAGTVTACSSTVGSATQPVYMNGGTVTACTYTLAKSVPSNAVFTDTDTHYASKNVVGSSTATSNTTTALTNGNVYLNSVENGAVTSAHKISGSGATTVTSDTSGNIVISSTNTNTTYSAGTGISLSGTTFSNSGVRSIATGGTNGTISVNTNGTSANVAVKGLGTSAYKTTRTLTAKGASGWKDASTDSGYVPDMSFIAYWNGAYSGTASNLSYCNQGAFGTAATAAKTDFAAASHTHSYLPLSGGTMSGNITFAGIGDTAKAAGLSWSGSTDGASIYYQTTAADRGHLVLNLIDDANVTLDIAAGGAVKSYFDYSGIFHGNVVGNLTGTATSATSATSATTATQLSTSAGSATQPVYFSGGKPVACSYTIAKSVPSNAVFTDTNTWTALKGSTTSAAGTAGYAPAPAAGAATRYLRCDGTWTVPPDTNTTYSAATTSAAGLMSAADKSKLDGIATGANAYTLPTATSSVLGGVKIGSNITVSSGTISLTKANVTSALGYTPPTTNTTYSVATTSANGLMSASDKTALNNLNNLIVVSTTEPTSAYCKLWIAI